MKTPSARARALLPTVGDVIRYEFLWPEGEAKGRDSDKERPCGVVVSRQVEGDQIVFLVPITTLNPNDPRAIKLQPGGPLGLKTECWIIPWTVNVFRWMGPDVRKAPSPSGAFWRYGQLSAALQRRLAEAVSAAASAGHARLVKRTE